MTFKDELGSDLSGLRGDFCSYATEFISSPAMKEILLAYVKLRTKTTSTAQKKVKTNSLETIFLNYCMVLW